MNLKRYGYYVGMTVVLLALCYMGWVRTSNPVPFSPSTPLNQFFQWCLWGVVLIVLPASVCVMMEEWEGPALEEARAKLNLDSFRGYGAEALRRSSAQTNRAAKSKQGGIARNSPEDKSQLFAGMLFVLASVCSLCWAATEVATQGVGKVPPVPLNPIFEVCTIALFLVWLPTPLLISLHYANKRKQEQEAKEAANRPQNRERGVRYGDEALTRLEEARRRRGASPLTPKEQLQLFGVVLFVLLLIFGIGLSVTEAPVQIRHKVEPSALNTFFMRCLQLVVCAGFPAFVIMGVLYAFNQWQAEQYAMGWADPPMSLAELVQQAITERKNSRKTPTEQNARFGMILLYSVVVCFLGWVGTSPPYRHPVPDEPGFLNLLFLRCLQLALFVGLPAFATVSFAPVYKRRQAEREAKEAEEAKARRAKAQQEIENRRRAEAEQKRRAEEEKRQAEAKSREEARKQEEAERARAEEERRRAEEERRKEEERRRAEEEAERLRPRPLHRIYNEATYDFIATRAYRSGKDLAEIERQLRLRHPSYVVEAVRERVAERIQQGR